MLTPARTVAILAAVWLAAASVLAYGGAFELMPPPLGIAPLVLAVIAGWTALYLLAPGVREAISGVGLWWLTALQAWRIAPGFLFVWYADQGLLPDTFAFRAGWGDILVGVLAIGAILVATRAAYWTVHVVGALDLLLAVYTGAALGFAGDPAMLTIGTFPVVLVPMVGVGLTMTAHVVAFDLLLRRERTVAAHA